MRRFKRGQRIIVQANDRIPDMVGRKGTVARLRSADNLAWVTMDDDLPADLVSFTSPSDDRHRNVLLAPEECEEVR